MRLVSKRKKRHPCVASPCELWVPTAQQKPQIQELLCWAPRSKAMEWCPQSLIKRTLVLWFEKGSSHVLGLKYDKALGHSDELNENGRPWSLQPLTSLAHPAQHISTWIYPEAFILQQWFCHGSEQPGLARAVSLFHRGEAQAS